MASREESGVWVERVIVAGLVCIFAGVMYVGWHVSRIVRRVEQTVDAVAVDVQQVSGTAARIAKDVDRIRDRVSRLEEKAEAAAGLDDVENMLDELSSLRRESKTTPSESPVSHVEIKALLTAVRKFDGTFLRSAKTVTPFRFYVYLEAKYLVFGDSVSSPEDFIERLATKRLTGETYYAVPADGAKLPLAEWLTARLKECRAAKALDAAEKKPAETPAPK